MSGTAESAEEWVAKAHGYMEGGDLDSALDAANQALEIHPFDDAWATKGSILFASGRFDEAERCIIQAIELSPSEPIYREALGRVYLEQDRDEDGLVSFRHAVELDAQNTESQIGMAVALTGLGRVQEARDHLTRLRDKHPDDAHLSELLVATIIESADHYLTEISDGSAAVTSETQFDQLSADVQLLRDIGVTDPELQNEARELADMVDRSGKSAWAPDRPYLWEARGKMMAGAALAIVIVAGLAHVVLALLTIVGLIYLFLNRYRVPLWKGAENYWRNGFDAEVHDPPRSVVRWGIGH